MRFTDLMIGTSLYFDAPLAKGSGNVEIGEFDKSFPVSGTIVPTPPADWELLQKLLGAAKRPDRMQSRNFNVAYVPYRDGRIVYHEGNEAVLSAEYSGCLMGVYEAAHQRRVAHVPKSNSIRNDCIGEFRDWFSAHSVQTGEDKARVAKAGYELTHYFQPFVESRDADLQAVLIGKLMQEGVIGNPYGFTVFGLVTAPENDCVSIWGVKPRTQPSTGELWHVLSVKKRSPVLDFKALAGKTNRAALAVLPE